MKSPASTPPALVLNVDDHEPGRYARSRVLRAAGYQVEEAASGYAALQLVQQLQPSLILLDVHLPDISGLEVCRRLRQTPELARIPVLQISASAVSDPQRVMGLDSGADAYLVSPIDADVLLATVRALLRMRFAERELQRVNAELLRSNAELNQFSYLVSHDLKEPLRTIRSFSALLNRRYRIQLDESANDYLTHIGDAAERMTLLLDDLLAYAQSGDQRDDDLQQVNLSGIVSAAAANLDRTLQENAATIEAETMPSIRGDETQLLQLFQNLIGNAIKYRSAHQAPVVRISADKEADRWLFSVSDNGIGIDPAHLKVIFQAFKRLHGREIPGSGIGLATCRRIVERHGGELWAESGGLGQGSTFWFTLPGNEPAGSAVAAQPPDQAS